MDYVTYSQKLDMLKAYIEKKRANTPAMLASKLEVSERTVLRMIVHLKEKGCNIVWSKKEKIYRILT